MCLGISAWDPTERQECGPELAEGHPEGWPGLCLAAHKCPGGMGCQGGVGELPVCQQQPRLTGCSHCGSRNACKPVTKGSLPGSSAGSRWRDWGSLPRTAGHWESSCAAHRPSVFRPFAVAAPLAGTGQHLLHTAFPHYACHLGLLGKMSSSVSFRVGQRTLDVALEDQGSGPSSAT